MKILYSGDSVRPSSGVANKMTQQAGEWERRGHDVWLITPWHHRAMPLEQVREKFSRTSFPEQTKRSLYERIHFRTLAIASLDMAARRLGADMIYSRELPPSPGLGKLLRGFTVVLEINSDSVSETRGWLHRTRKFIQRKRFIGGAQGIVYISRELTRLHGGFDSTRKLVIANGCLTPPSSALPGRGSRNRKRPKLAFVGSDRQPWTGADKVLWLAENLPEFDFLVVGSLIKGPANLTCHPAVTSDRVTELVAGSTVGISSLALHRIGMNEASPLKSRHYLSMGLPLIQAYEDTDVTEEDGCILQLPNREHLGENSIDRVRDFVLGAHRSDGPSIKALSLAQGRLSLEAKETRRLAFFEQCVSDTQGEVAGG